MVEERREEARQLPDPEKGLNPVKEGWKEEGIHLRTVLSRRSCTAVQF